MGSTGISPKWSKTAKSFIGDAEGRHCHWCKHIKTFEGTAECGNKKSKFCDGDRIRTWDGLGCAKECGLFELQDWYKEDKNHDEYFKSTD